MRAMHLYEDISPPYPEVFRASAYVNAKGGEEANKPIMERPGGYRRKKELGGRRKPEGEGGEGETTGGVARDGDGLRAKQRAVLDRTALWK